MIFGTVYMNLLDQDESVMRHDMELIRELEMNTVVLWPPRHFGPDGSDAGFDRNVQFMDMAHEYGLRVVVELLGQIENLEFMPAGAMKHEHFRQPGTSMNYNHPDVMAAAVAHTVECVKAFKDHPALMGFDIYNEVHHMTSDSFTLDAYRRRLREKYEGQIARLNRNWQTTYSDFSEVRFENPCWASVCADVDLVNFRRHNTAAIIGAFAEAVRENAPQAKVICDNVMSVTLHAGMGRMRATDDWLIADLVDIYGISQYVKTAGRIAKRENRYTRCQTLEAARSAARGKPFVVTELQSGSFNAFSPVSAASRQDIADWLNESLDMGAEGVIFWKWKPFETGLQTGGRGLVSYAGNPTERYEGAQSVDMQPRPISTPDVGIYFSPTIEALMGSYLQIYTRIPESGVNVEMYFDAIHGWYRLLHVLEKRVQFLHEDFLSEDLEGLKTVIIPYPVTFSEKNVAVIEKFVEGGGLVIFENPVVYVDDTTRRAPFPFGELDVSNFDRCTDAFQWGNTALGVKTSRIAVLSCNWDVAAEFPDGQPAVLTRDSGAGRYVALLGDASETFIDMPAAKLKDVAASIFG